MAQEPRKPAENPRPERTGRLTENQRPIVEGDQRGIYKPAEYYTPQTPVRPDAPEPPAPQDE